jgi:hypothetical protein
MSAMSDGTQGPTRPDSDGDGASVLQNLPRTRPQRASPRRAAARQSAARKTASEGSKPRATPTPSRRPRRSTPKLEQVPPQGYESEDDAATGAVRPPGGAELVLSAAEIVGELAKAGLGRSERLVKDVLARLPLS